MGLFIFIFLFLFPFLFFVFLFDKVLNKEDILFLNFNLILSGAPKTLTNIISCKVIKDEILNCFPLQRAYFC